MFKKIAQNELSGMNLRISLIYLYMTQSKLRRTFCGHFPEKNLTSEVFNKNKYRQTPPNQFFL